MTDNSAEKAPPPGFEFYPSRGPFSTRNGPMCRAIEKDDLRSGLWVLDRHCNGLGFMHGGMISAFADGALAWAVGAATRKSSVTLKLTTSFYDIIRPGEWLEAQPEVLSVDDGVVQVTADLKVGGEKLAARADATFRTVRRTVK